MIAIPNKDKPKNAFNCSIKINPEERRCIYTGKVFEETLSLLIDRPCDDCPLIDIVPCKECKRWTKLEGGIWEEIEGEYGFCALKVDAYNNFGGDNFCSYAERANADQHTQCVEEGGKR